MPSAKAVYKAIIFDRDGTLNDMATNNLYYVLSPTDLKLYPDVRPTLKSLRSRGILPFVFTQQNGIGKGELTEETLTAIHQKMQIDLGEQAKIEKFYHAPSNDHPFAKPSSGMINAIMTDYNLTPAQVLVIGDTLRDYQSAKNAGVDFIKIERPNSKTEPWPKGLQTIQSLKELSALF